MNSIIRYSICRISDLKVYLSVIVDSDKVSSFKGKIINTASITKKEIPGSSLYDITIFPYITLEICNYEDKKEAIYDGVHINISPKLKLNRYNLYLFIGLLKKIEKDFVEKKNLYYYSNGRLVLNNEVSKDVSIETSIGDSGVIIYPTVISVGGGEKEHEGISLSIRDLSNTVYLTYTEIGYLRYTLSKIDMDNIAIKLIQLVGENKIKKLTKSSIVSISEAPETVTRPEVLDNSSTNNYIIKNENVIPNL